MKERTALSMQLYGMLLERGYHEELCDVITKNLNTDFTAARMIGYLCQYSYLPEEQLVDEMLAILSDREALIKKKKWNRPRQKSTRFTNMALVWKKRSKAKKSLYNMCELLPVK